MIFFERNMKLLAEYQKDVFTKLQTATSKNIFQDHLIGFGQNEKGVMDNVVININGQLFIAGKEDEAEVWTQGIDTTSHTIVVFGLGMGFHIEKLIRKFPNINVIVIEPDKRVLGHAMYLRDMEFIFKNVTLWVDETVVDVKIKLFEMLTHPLARGIAVVPFYIAVYKPYSDLLYAELQKMMNDWAVMINTKRSLADKWYMNRMANAKCPSVNMQSLIGKFKDIPGILVGAAPSLQSQIEQLKALQGKAVIIAASTAAEILKSHGIKPTFMIAIDQDPITSGALHENMDGDIPLIFDGQVAQNSLHYKGRKFQMLLNVNRYTGMVIPNMPIMESGPSVANVTLDVLHKLGCSPILICGMDMSYTDDKLYCDGTRFQKDVTDHTNLIPMPDNTGGTCYTEPSFLSMRNWYEEYIPRVKPPVFNCTAKGLPIAGCENKTFADFDLSKTYDIDKIVDEAYYLPGTQTPNFIDLQAVIRINKDICNELDKLRETVRTTNGITPELSQTRAWAILDEFVSANVYLDEIRAEYKMSTKGMDAEECVRHFQDRRKAWILDNVDIVKRLLES